MLDSGSSPISKILDEILLMIFEINTRMNDDDLDQDGPLRAPQGLDATRYSSQVCSLWRGLSINASYLWANLIDIASLDRVGTRWREEAIRRTKNSPLHIRGTIYLECLKDTGPWLSEFLNNNWSRTRRFNVQVLTDVRYHSPDSVITHDKAPTYRKTLVCLSKPATALEFFVIDFLHYSNPLATGSTLFSGHAPRLRSFKTRRMILPIAQCPTWLPQIHHFQIFECHSLSFASVDVLYQILSQMTHLECLSLEDAIGSPYISIQHYPIHLPCLQRIQIREDGRLKSGKKLACWSLLNSIIPKAGCSVDVSIKPNDVADVDIPVLCRLAKNYFDIHHSTNLDLGSGVNSFWLKDFGNRSNEDPPQGMLPFFCLRIDNVGRVQKIGDMTMYRLFEALSFLTFPRVIDLSLVLSTAHSIAFKDPKFSKLFRSLSSTEMLTATVSVLYEICSFGSIFPRLKTLEIPDFVSPSEYDIRAPFSGVLLAFLKLQQVSGAPVSKFHYYADFDSASQTLPNLACLERFTGLQVEWDTNPIGSGEYICGSGKPDELNLTKKLIKSGVIPTRQVGNFTIMTVPLDSELDL